MASRNQGSGQKFLDLHVPHVSSNNRHSAHLCRGPSALRCRRIRFYAHAMAVVSEVTASAEVTAAVVQVAEVAPSSTAAGNRRKHTLALAQAVLARDNALLRRKDPTYRRIRGTPTPIFHSPTAMLFSPTCDCTNRMSRWQIRIVLDALVAGSVKSRIA